MDANTINHDEVEKLGLEEAVAEQIKKLKDTLFFIKGSDWVGEGEYRYVIYSKSEGYVTVSFGESLKAVVLGVDCPEVYFPIVKDLVKKIPVIKLMWDGHEADFWYISI